MFTQVNALPSLLSKPQKALWACTYLYAVKECEEYWPHEESDRHEFSKVYLPQYEERVTELALWVWEQRFLHSGYAVEMGGRMAVDILEVFFYFHIFFLLSLSLLVSNSTHYFAYLFIYQHVLNLEHSINFFSGHDYTLLGTICALNLVSEFKIALNFSAYILFEFWDSPPADSSLVNDHHDAIVRVLLNPTPFKTPDGSASRTVQTHATIILKDFKINEIVNILQHLRSLTSNLYMKPIKKDKEIISDIPINQVTTEISNKDSEQETEIDMLS